MELVRQKGVATYIQFPLVDAAGNYISGEDSGANADSEIDTWSDGAAPDGYTDCTNEIAENGTSGRYYLSLTASEMNADYISIKVVTDNSSGQEILIRTIIGDPLNAATNTSGRELGVAADGDISGNVDGSVASVSGTVAANMTQIGGVAQSATDLKDFADTGYDPTTHKVQGVVLTDTCTTNTDMRGTNSAALASVCTEARLSELDAGTGGKMANQVDVIQQDTTTDIPTQITAIDGSTFDSIPDMATATAQGTAQADLDILTGVDGATLATLQANYAPMLASEDGSSLTAIPARTVEGAYDEDDILRLIVRALIAKAGYDTGTVTWTVRDLADTKDSITITYGTDNGDRDTLTINDAT